MLAIRTLSEMSRTVNAKEILWTSETCPFRTLSFVSCKEMLSKLETKLSTFSEVSKYLNYFEDVFENKKIHMRRKELKCLLSPENMDLHQDYKEKIAVLESLEFIDKQRKVMSITENNFCLYFARLLLYYVSSIIRLLAGVITKQYILIKLLKEVLVSQRNLLVAASQPPLQSEQLIGNSWQ